MIERRLINFYISRLFTFLLFFLVVLIFNAFKEPNETKVIHVAISLAIYGAINFIYYSSKKLKANILPILILDTVFISLIVYFTGGIQSNFHILYLILIVFAGFYVEKTHLYFLATVSVIGFMASVSITYLKTPKHFGLSTFYLISYPVAVYFVAIFTISLIIISINKRAKKLKESLREKEMQIEEITRLKNKIVDTITSGIITTDKDLKINFINPQGIEYLKKIYPGEEVLGKNLKELFPVKDFVDKLDFLDRYIVEIQDRLFGVSMVKLFSDKQFKGFLVVFQDLTKIKQMEKKAQFKNKMVELGELSASFAHEFRNSLASIKGAIQLLKEEDEIDKELLTVIDNEINRLATEINDFLRFARKDFQKPDYAPIVPIVKATVEKFQSLLDRDIHFEYIQNVEESASAYFESVRLKKVLFNLLMNARKAVDYVDRKNIRMKLYQDGNHIVVEVQDTGIGIKDNYKSKVFEPYYSGFAKGIGMGLALSRTFIEEMNGEIHFDSEEGKGTIFKVMLVKEGENEK